MPVKATAKTLIVQNRFHPNQPQPTGYENKFVFNWQGRAGRYFYGYHPPYAVSHTRRLRDLLNCLIPEVWLWLSLLRNGIIRYAGTSRVKE